MLGNQHGGTVVSLQTSLSSQLRTSRACEIPSGSENSSPLELEGRVTCGEEVRSECCAGCHGTDGEGTAQGQVLKRPYRCTR